MARLRLTTSHIPALIILFCTVFFPQLFQLDVKMTNTLDHQKVTEFTKTKFKDHREMSVSMKMNVQSPQNVSEFTMTKSLDHRKVSEFTKTKFQVLRKMSVFMTMNVQSPQNVSEVTMTKFLDH